MASGMGNPLSWSSHNIVLANRLHRLYVQSSMLDVRLVCEQEHIYAHKVVLAAGSNFFWERLHSLGVGMVELQVSSTNLGTPITPGDLRAVIDYMYCGELSVPPQRWPFVLDLVRSLQVFGFQTDAESQFTTPNEIHYTTEASNVIELQTDRPQISLEGAVEATQALAEHSSLPVLAVKPQEQNILQDPPKYSEPLKLDTNLSLHGSSTNMSFSELCTAPGADGDIFAGQCNQVKHNIPSVFESSVLEDNSLGFKARPSECTEVFSKPDSDVYSGAVLNLTSEPDATSEDSHMTDISKEVRGSQRDPRQASTCVLEGDADDPYNTVLLLETLAGEAAGTPNQAVVDVDSIFLTEDAKMAVSPRWIRSRKSFRASAESRVRLKVKDSIGGVSLQDTSQRQSNVCPSVQASSPDDVPSGADIKESWMVVVPEGTRGIPLVQAATNINTLHSQLSMPHSAQELSHDHTAAIHLDSTSMTSQAPIPPLATVSVSSPLISQTSCAGSIPVLTNSSGSNPGSILGHSSLPNAASLLTQPSLSFAPYIQPSLLSTTVLNQSDITQTHQTLSAIPMQVLPAQSLDSEASVSYSPSAPYIGTASSVSSQSSLLPVHVQTQTSVATGLPPVTSITSTSPLTTSSRTSPAVSSESDLPPTPLASSSFGPVSHSSVSSAPDLLSSGISNSGISTPLIIQSSIASNILLTQPPISTPLLAAPSLITTPMLTQSNTDISPVVIGQIPALPPPPPPPPPSPPATVSSNTPISSELPFTSSSDSLGPGSSPSVSSPELFDTSAPMTETPIISVSSTSRPTCEGALTATSSSQVSSIPSTSSCIAFSTRSSPSTTVDDSDSNMANAAITSVTSINDRIFSETINTSSSPISITPSSPDHTSEYPAESEEDDTHECTHCPQVFKTLDKLTLHLWEEHEIGTAAKCQLCDFSSPLQRTLVEHAATHITKDNNTCAICSKKFKTRATIKTHLRVHLGEEVMYKCDSCPVMYSQKFNLIKHMASKHQQDAHGQPLTESLTCPYCAFTTFAEYKLKAHIVRRHSVDKPFKCDHCTYATTEKTALAKHLRTHTKERPYICEICSFHALTLSSLWRHRRSHTGEKPYECEQCGQQYADSKRLRDHMYKHNNVKPFMCHMCGYTCRRKDNLQTHLQKIHKLEDKKGRVVSKSSPSSGKAKRGKGHTHSNASTNKNGQEASEVTDTHINNLDDVKVKARPDASKLQVWVDHSYDTRGESGSLLVNNSEQVVGCGGGEVDPGSGQEQGSTHRPFTTTNTIPAQTLQSTGPACMGIRGATSTLQLSYLLPVAAPSDPNMTLGASTEGIILVGQTEVSHPQKAFL